MSKMDFSHTSYPCHEYDFAASDARAEAAAATR
jgi:hypothetical protein